MLLESVEPPSGVVGQLLGTVWSGLETAEPHLGTVGPHPGSVEPRPRDLEVDDFQDRVLAHSVTVRPAAGGSLSDADVVHFQLESFLSSRNC